MGSCELCDLVAGDVKTRKYYRDKTCLVVDSLSRKVPMVVLNHHGRANDREKRLMLAVVNYLFIYDRLDMGMEHIPDHEHWEILGAKFLGAG